MQSTEPTKVARRSQIDRKCAFILQADGVVDGGSEIGQACLKEARGSEQLGFNGHREAVSAFEALLKELWDEDISIGRP